LLLPLTPEQRKQITAEAKYLDRAHRCEAHERLLQIPENTKWLATRLKEGKW